MSFAIQLVHLVICVQTTVCELNISLIHWNWHIFHSEVEIGWKGSHAQATQNNIKSPMRGLYSSPLLPFAANQYNGQM